MNTLQHPPPPPQPSIPPSSPAIPYFDPATFVVDDIATCDPNVITNDFKHQIRTQVFANTQNPPPPQIAEAFADRVVWGHFKYHDSGTREFRHSFNNFDYSQLQDIRDLPVLTEDATLDHRIERALELAITTYFRAQCATRPITQSDNQAIHIPGRDEMHFQPREQASAYISELVHIIFQSATGDAEARASVVTNLVAGVPSTSIFGESGQKVTDEIGQAMPQDDVYMLYWAFLPSMISNRIDLDATPIYNDSVSRWKAAMGSKLAFWVLSGSDRNIFDVASRFVDLDFTHNRIESGLALSHPILGSAIVSPFSATTSILYEMAGCVQTRKTRQLGRINSNHVAFQKLHDVDKGINYNIYGIEGNEQTMVSLQNYFREGDLANFFDSQIRRNNAGCALISSDGIVLYRPKEIGPWADFAFSQGKGGRDPMKLVLRISDDDRNVAQTRKLIQNKSRRMQTDWLLDCPVSEETKKRFRYIVNKPGRALVRRTGVRGNYGRIIAAILLICGATVTGLNFAGRDTWLERVFDGAQVASLLAFVTVAIIFLLSGTLVDTLDLLAGKTEAQDVEQICTLTDLTIEELQGVLTYARGTLYWLSERGASYCRATKLGSIVMTHPLSVAQNPETKYSFVADDAGDDLAAVWVMQGRLSKLKKINTGNETIHVEDIPFERRFVRAFHSMGTGIFQRDINLE